LKKYLILGLGNIGAEYKNTRHNIGFLVLDALAEASNISFSPARYGDKAELSLKGRKLILIKPSTYMNLSGKALRYWMQEEKIPLENILIIVDDVAIDFGALRMKTKGSDGGHNGLKHINQTLGRQDYSRIRFGIGGDYPKGGQVDFVLGEWSEEEMKTLPERIKTCAEMVKSFVLAGPALTMNTFNKK
jgi:PTH1 family peptidyl-tRNA hydrolase